MRKRQIVFLLLLTMLLAGCGKVQNEPEGSSVPEAESSTADKEKETAAESDVQEEILSVDQMQGSMVLEDDQAIYISGTHQINKIDKKSKEGSVLWKGEMSVQSPYIFTNGSAVLLNGRIYFVEERWEKADTQQKFFLSVINSDGTEYRELKELEGYNETLFYTDGRLYISDYENEYGFDVQPDGSVVEIEDLYRDTEYPSVPEGYARLSYTHGVSRYLGALESVNKYGYLLLINPEYRVAAVDPDTGEELWVMQEEAQLRAINDKYFLVSEYEQQHIKLYLIDVHTFETRNLAELDSNTDLIDMDEEFAYIHRGNSENEPERKYIYEKIALSDGTVSEMFSLKENSYYVMSGLVYHGYLYYSDARDYKQYLMRRSLEDPEKEEVLGDAYYDTGISQVGTIETYHDEILSQVKPDFVLTELDLERLVVDDKFAGAAEINRILTEYENGVITYATGNLEWQEEELKNMGEEEFSYLHYSYSSKVSDISYFDGNYFSFTQVDYDYQGGAHGMPIWTGFTFDLQTGARLSLTDIIGNSEEELKEIVTRHFSEYIGQAPEAFWEDAVDTVRENINFNSDFYLNENGITFYFSPYELASYAAGFQEVTVPFEEFEMKIPLK